MVTKAATQPYQYKGGEIVKFKAYSELEPGQTALFEVGDFAHIRVDADAFVAETRDLAFQRFRRLRMRHIVDDDAGALPGQLKNNRLSNSSVATGDDRDLVLQ